MSLFAEFPQTVTFIRKGINFCLRGTPNVSVNVCLSISFWVYILASVQADILSNTGNFHCKFRFILSLHLSESAQNVHFREARFQNFPGEHAPGHPYCTRAFGARYYFCRTSSELLPPGLLLPMCKTQFNITYLTYTKRYFFSQYKRVHLPYYTEIYILRTADMSSAQA